MRRAGFALAMVATWAALAASCGGSGEVTKQEYGRELRDVMQELESAYGDAGKAVSASGAGANANVEQIVADLKTAQIALRDAGNRLDSIEPPTKLQDEHDALVAGVRDMADAVDLLIEAQQVAETDPARAKALAREFATDDSFGAVEAAAAKLEEAGVDAGL